MKRVLFLDFDGVLNSTERASKGIPYQVFMPEALQFLTTLVNEGIDIVVSSSWRCRRTIRQLSNILGVPVSGVTPEMDGDRGEEVQAYINAHAVDVYCIVDDDSDMLLGQRPYFVQTDSAVGLSPDNMAAILHCLTERTHASDE